jgi:UDP-N-acetylmuramyl pentapeptide phosphotransferase/UDP-N-acetylglucosamine-1-phosphate transferase/NAD(P)-dependent dehydrogenase (short-subunit alcohol dehydrogenase family)
MIALVTFVGTLLVSYAGTLLLLRRRPTRGFVDVPNERSSHETPKPRFGGIAIVVAFLGGMAVLWVFAPDTRQLLPLAAGGTLLFVTGLVDDWRGLSVGVRFTVQLLVSVIAVASGAVLSHIELPMVGTVGLGWMAMPVTCLFIMASINFYNFIDGIDGLAGGSAFIASVFLALIAMILGHNWLALVFLALAGSAVGFLQFNFPPSRLFMGDGGSTFLGYVFAYLAVVGNGLQPELPVFIPLLILSALYLDAGLTLFNRLTRGEKIFQPHHTHYYQRLLSLGLNHKQVTLLEYLLVVLLGVSAVVYFKAGEFFAVFLTGCWFLVFTAAILKIRGLERGDRLFWEKRTLFVIAADVVLITIAYVGAYFLRMNFQFTQAEGTAMLRALPIVLVVRTACFHRYGLYRTVWKYTSVSDIVRIIKAVTTGSVIILTAVVLLFRFIAFPRTLFIIEYFLLIVLILGSRFAMRLFHEIGKEAHGDNVRRYAIIGAGDYGERLAREVRSHEGRRSAVACFVDDDPTKAGLMLHGAPIVGPIDRLGEIAREHRVDALLLGISRLDDERSAQVVELAREAELPLEGHRDASTDRLAPSSVIFDRLGRMLHRPRAARPKPGETALRGRRVLVTHGGDRIGRPLVRELIRSGASVTVQLGSVREERVTRGAFEDAVVQLGPLSSLEVVRGLVDAVVPDVVVHCVSLDASGDRGVEDELWEETVMTTDRLLRAFAARPAGAFVLLTFWDGAEATGAGARMAAIAEALVLNRTLREGVTASAVRFPRILTGDAVRSVLAGADERPFDLMENEAVSVSLGAVEEGIHGLFTPVWQGALTSDLVRAATGRGDNDEAGEPSLSPSAWRNGPVFPSEQLQEVATTAVKRVVGPLYPAHDALRKIVKNATLDGSESTRVEWMGMMGAHLYQLVPSGLRFSVDA